MKSHVLQVDPSRTALERRAFVAEMVRRFGAVKKAVWDLIMKDEFGLVQNADLLKMENGHTLHLISSQTNSAREKRDVWHSRDGNGEVSGHFEVTHYPDSPHPALDQAEAYQRGKGIGRHVIQTLVKHYGSLRSADNGMTSDEANRAWQSVGAKHLGPESRAGGESEFLVRNAEDQVGPVGNAAWDYNTDPQKVDAFRKWIQRLANVKILEARTESGLPSVKKPWMAPRILSAFKKGVIRAYVEAKKVESGKPDFAAGKEQRHLESVMAVQTNKLQILYTRCYEDLAGITADMATKLSRALATGLMNGDTPHMIARKMAATMDISLKRAKMIARTEIVNAHAEGTLDGLEVMGVKRVGAVVEFESMNDDKVCPKCKKLDGRVFTIKQARGKIPVHVCCRCCWRPI